jgi:protein-S-isoprenylcysteine O-methyltransferase Ste14
MSPFIRTIIFTILVPGFWTVVMPYWLLPGWFLVAGGIALYFACAFWGFALRGKGTPAPIDPPKKLVEEGPYRIVRNPMYWSVAFVLLGEALVFHSLALVELAAAFFLGTNLFVLFYEEPALRRKFGAEYEDYCRRVPRWLPRFKSKLD